MSEMRDIEVELVGAGKAVVKVDGRELRGVTRVVVELGVDEAPKVHLDCIATNGYVKLEETDVAIEPRVVTVDRSETA